MKWEKIACTYVCRYITFIVANAAFLYRFEAFSSIIMVDVQENYSNYTSS